jgi:hypothetical protein
MQFRFRPIRLTTTAVALTSFVHLVHAQPVPTSPAPKAPVAPAPTESAPADAAPAPAAPSTTDSPAAPTAEPPTAPPPNAPAPSAPTAADKLDPGDAPAAPQTGTSATAASINAPQPAVDAELDATAAAAELPPPEPLVEELPEATTEEGGFKLNVGVAIRSGLALTFDDPQADAPVLALNDGIPNATNQANQVNIRPLFGGQLTDRVGFTFNLEANQSSIAVLDAIIQLKIADEFQIWAGQHIPAMERNNFNGPFYNNGWNLPIQVQTLPFDIAGRDRGITFWGLVAGGIVKYHASVVDLVQATRIVDTDDPTDGFEGAGLANARFAGRLTINLLDPENYYYTSGTYYGKQDTLALGAVYHYQKGVDRLDGTDADNDLSAVAADLLYEQNFNDAGTFTVNAGFWSYGGTGRNYSPNLGTTNAPGVAGPGYGDQSYLFAVSWLTPGKVCFGQLQPNVQVQIGDYGTPITVIDAGLSYVIDGFNHRWHLNYRHVDTDNSDDLDMLQIGAQLQL